MKITPKLLKFGLNIYGPYLGAGIKVDHISEDWKKLKVSMKLRWYNKNYMSVHFGGSLYAMVDPHLMLMLIQLLGKSYQVWDQSAQIEFKRPGKGRVHSTLEITDNDLDDIKKNTASGEKYHHQFPVTIIDSDNQLVARVNKVLYIRKKPER
jgi:hypothetical protein